MAAGYGEDGPAPDIYQDKAFSEYNQKGPLYGTGGQVAGGYAPNQFQVGGSGYTQVKDATDFSGLKDTFGGAAKFGYDPTFGWGFDSSLMQTPQWQQHQDAIGAANKKGTWLDKVAAAVPFAAAGALGGGLAFGGLGEAAAAGSELAGPASGFIGAPVETGLGGWSVGTDALLEGGAGATGAIQGAFPLTAGMEGAGVAAGAAGAIAPSLGGPFVDGFNVLDPATYSGAAAPAAGGGASFIDATNPAATLSPEVAKMLGIAPVETGLGALNLAGPAAEFSGPLTASQVATGGGFGGPALEGFNMLDPATYSGAGAGSGISEEVLRRAGTTAAEEALKKAKGDSDWLNPRNAMAAAGLGLSAAQALKKPQLPEAAQAVQNANTPIPAAAQASINSGGTSSPAWATQKSAIDAKIDQQIQQAKQAILQKMQNSGMGPDSLVAQQQIQQAVQQLEGMRQQQYQQAQAQNVQAALSELGMSNQALQGVAGMQYKSSEQAQNQASETARLTMMLYQLMNPTANAQQQGQPARP